ncbi:MAG: UvrD-helicase domain-containing protein [Candidatus Obscuribacterales bacterium]|nr:UvrD-helicase domain-containing protein [Candidatus Obscuribacterales bacterium]
MAFLIPDNLRSRQDVPAAIRRIAGAFEIGLDETATVWFEPLYDPSGNKPHLVVLLPERGVAVLEVIECRSSGDNNEKPQFLRDGDSLDDPFQRINKLAQILEKRFQGEPKVSHLGLSVAPGICFSNLTSTEAQERGISDLYPPEFCIYKDEIDAAISGTGQSSLMRAFTRLLGSPVLDEVNDEVEKALRGVVQPGTVIGIATQSPSEALQVFQEPSEGEDIVRVMDRQQEAMAKSLGEGHRIIRGVAGSGKTLILVFRAKLIAENYPEKRILVTCYTKTLASQLQSLLSNYANVDVVHLHSLMYEVCKKARIKTPKWADEGALEKITSLSLEGIACGAGPRYDVILIDEAQDFSTDEIRFASELLKETSEDLVIVADAAQNIYKRKFSWRQAGVKAQGRTRILRINYRNTREILEFASKFLLTGDQLSPQEVPDYEDENSVIPPESAKRTGPVPQVEFVSDVNSEIEKTIEVVRCRLNKLREGEKIAVLYPGTDGKDRGYFLDRKFRESGIDAYWATNTKNHGAKAGLATAAQKVILSTIHSAKGLEFPYVVLCGIWKQKDEKEQNRKLAYVGMTRATDHLTVITRDGHPLISDLRLACPL